VRLIELLGVSERSLSRELLTGIRDSKARPDLLPPPGIIRHIPSQPHGEPVEVVVVVGAPQHRVRPGAPGDGEGEDEQRDEEHDERRHREEVERKEPAPVPVRADEAGERGQEEQAAEDRHGPPRQPRALLALR